MMKIIEKLEAQREEFSDKLEKINTALKALRDVCEHEWISTGHDSHHEHCLCTECGKTDYDML